MTPFHDYAYYLQVAERNLKQIENKVLHKEYNIDQNVRDIMMALSGLMVWTEDVQQEPQSKK